MRIYAGFDYHFANATRVNKREINLHAEYRATNPRDDSLPFINEVLTKNRRMAHAQECAGEGEDGDTLDSEWNDHRGYYNQDEDLDRVVLLIGKPLLTARL